MYKQCMKYLSENKHKSILLGLLAVIVLILHAIVPHTSHTRHFNSVVNLLGEDFERSFNHHDFSLEQNHPGAEYVFSLDVGEKITAGTNAKVKDIPGYPPFYMVDNPPDIGLLETSRVCYSDFVNIDFTSYIQSAGGLRAPPVS
ncbi:MAG: hypothetical protein ACLTWE_08175 [Dysgonomonas mossii]|uniref:hypothetical protein n=1 Tax=Dysgonomonas mossii TaxID=163665 RepID=UPI0039934DAF